MTIVVVSQDDLLLRRVREALVRGGAQIATADARLQAGDEPVDAIVLAGCGAVSAQRAQLRLAASRFPGVPCVMIASLSSNGVRKALDAGAVGVVLESDLERSLMATVNAVRVGQVVVPHRVRHAIRPPLSHREKETLALAAQGLTNRQIAEELFLAESTVKTHLASVFTKLGVSTRSEATAMALDPEEHLGLGVITPARAQAAGA